MLKFPENAHFDRLKVISKRVESMADKFRIYVPNTAVMTFEIIDLQVVCAEWYLGYSE
jgi:hypothetical protein